MTIAISTLSSCRIVGRAGHFQPNAEGSPSVSAMGNVYIRPVGVLQYGFEHVVGIRQVSTPTLHDSRDCVAVDLLPSGVQLAPVFRLVEACSEAICLDFIVAKS